MLTHVEKAAHYQRMIFTLETDGWIQDSLADSNGVCLVGAVHSVTWDRDERIELQKELADYIAKHYIAGRWSRLRALRYGGDKYGFITYDECGMVAHWNDMPGRRKQTVISVIDKLATKHEILAAPEREQQLRIQIRLLKQELEDARKRIAELEAEVTWWKARRARVTVNELREEMPELEESLNAAMAELEQVTS